MPRPPGQVGPNVAPQVRMMVCTAGHVDHGKTKLVRLLTGCRTDKLKTEIERGLTIELGFAPCLIDAGDGLSIGIVDVPGHEKFIRNMVAGVSGIEMTILVVAADDGVMPQTVEHLQIMELLGVRDGIVVLNKIDLVDKELLELQMEDLKEFLKGTFLEDAPICPLSSETFDGYFEFYDVLVEKVKAAGARERKADPRVFRLPVERTFSKEGFGTVVTGIPVSGSISIGTPVEVVPGNLNGKVRTIQCFLRDAETAERGKCCALNIGELDRDEVARGSVVATRGYFSPATIIHVRAVNVPNLERPMKNGEEIRFHAGTSEAHGKLYLLKELDSGEWYATVALQDPVVVATGDRFLIRRPSENRTIGGGDILRIDSGKNRPRKAQVVPDLERIDAVKIEAKELGLAGGAAAMLHALRVDARTQGAGVDILARAAQLPQEAAEGVLVELLDRGLICELPGRQFMDTATYNASKTEAARRVQSQADAGEVVVRQNDIREGLDWPPHLWRAILGDLEEEGMFERSGDRLVLSSGLDGLSDSDRKVAEKIIEVYQEGLWATPRPEELPDIIKVPARDVDRLIEYLCEQNELVQVSKNVVFSMDNFRKAQEMVVEIIQEHGTLESGLFKNKINSTRKYALAFLDYLDGRRITVRIGNDRKLSRDYERNLV